MWMRPKLQNPKHRDCLLLSSSVPGQTFIMSSKSLYLSKFILLEKGVIVSCVPVDSNSAVRSSRVLSVNTRLGLGLLPRHLIVRNRKEGGSRIEE